MHMFANRYGHDSGSQNASIDDSLSSGDVTKCAETLQKLISTRREHGTRSQVGMFDVTSECQIDSVSRVGSERPLLLASRLVLVGDIVTFATTGPNEPDCVFNI